MSMNTNKVSLDLYATNKLIIKLIQDPINKDYINNKGAVILKVLSYLLPICLFCS
jgi:hypothetical protein